jgi:hypothetical protein
MILSETIGIPIRIGNIEIAQYDFQKEINWFESNDITIELGDGWRLPNKQELNLLFTNKDKIGGFKSKAYWSSSLVSKNGKALVKYFDNGSELDFSISMNAFSRFIRVVNSKKNEDLVEKIYEVNEIVGKPIKIDRIEVTKFNFKEEMNWDDANFQCNNLGNGWRLPNRLELNILFNNKEKIGGFNKSNYWSATPTGLYYYYQDFVMGYKSPADKNMKFFVRPVRNI